MRSASCIYCQTELFKIFIKLNVSNLWPERKWFKFLFTVFVAKLRVAVGKSEGGIIEKNQLDHSCERKSLKRKEKREIWLQIGGKVGFLLWRNMLMICKFSLVLFTTSKISGFFLFLFADIRLYGFNLRNITTLMVKTVWFSGVWLLLLNCFYIRQCFSWGSSRDYSVLVGSISCKRGDFSFSKLSKIFENRMHRF